MLVVPFYSVLTKYHLTNSLLGLIIVYAATNIAFSTWMMTSYFKTIPVELDEAARVDGASSFNDFPQNNIASGYSGYCSRSNLCSD